MKKALGTVLMMVCGFCSAQAEIVDRIYAQVNDDIITLSDVNREMAPISKELSAQYKGAQLEQALQKEKEQVLDNLIQEKLLIQKAIELGIDTDIEPEVASEIQRIMKQYGIDTQDKFEEALEQQGTNLRDFRELVKNQIMADEVIRVFVRSRITLMSSEVEKYYKDHASEYATPEEVSLSEIVITAAAEGSEENAKNRANDLYNRLKAGEAFAALAGQYSKGATANKGGSIGSNLLEKWHPDIIKAIKGLETGDISEPQKTDDGYVIYRVDERKRSRIPPLSEVESQIKNSLYMEKYTPELKRYVSRLKEEAYIQIYPETE
jgi:peptidyl-prolyl cis-trans isomerase SurA